MCFPDVSFAFFFHCITCYWLTEMEYFWSLFEHIPEIKILWHVFTTDHLFNKPYVSLHHEYDTTFYGLKSPYRDPSKVSVYIIHPVKSIMILVQNFHHWCNVQPSHFKNLKCNLSKKGKQHKFTILLGVKNGSVLQVYKKLTKSSFDWIVCLKHKLCVYLTSHVLHKISIYISFISFLTFLFSKNKTSSTCDWRRTQ